MAVYIDVSYKKPLFGINNLYTHAHARHYDMAYMCVRTSHMVYQWFMHVTRSCYRVIFFLRNESNEIVIILPFKLAVNCNLRM